MKFLSPLPRNYPNHLTSPLASLHDPTIPSPLPITFPVPSHPNNLSHPILSHLVPSRPFVLFKMACGSGQLEGQNIQHHCLTHLYLYSRRLCSGGTGVNWLPFINNSD